MTTNLTNNWTPYWWLRIDQSRSWSYEEWRACGILLFGFAGTSMLSFFGCWALISPLGLSTSTNEIISLALVIVLLPHVRDMTNDMSAGKVHAGDVAAARRLGGVVPKNEEPKFDTLWWLDYKFAGWSRWSSDEILAQRMILGIALLLFLLPLEPEISFLQSIGMSKAVWVITLTLPVAIFASRRLCVWLCPKLMRRADDLARARQTTPKT